VVLHTGHFADIPENCAEPATGEKLLAETKCPASKKTHEKLLKRRAYTLPQTFSSFKKLEPTNFALKPSPPLPGSTMTTSFPTLQHFNAYHSMLCRPTTAKLCTSYFSKSKILFVRENEAPSTGDFTAKLTWYYYYALVAYSLTGISTALGLTETLDCSEDLSSGLSTCPPNHLTLYLSDGDNNRTLRHFQYNFRLPGITVDMWHVQGETAVHLVEVYRGGYRAMAFWGAAIAAFVGVTKLKK
jgi:hypothetical protein